MAIHTETELAYLSLANGAAEQLFDRELKKVVENINDHNTDPTAKRKILLEVTLSADKTRTMVNYSVGCKSKLAPHEKLEGVGYVGEGDRIMQKDPNQASLFGGIGEDELENPNEAQ